MNNRLIKEYIHLYKEQFERIHNEEIYKWRAIKQFQETFDLEADDFHENLSAALSRTANLLDSGQYYPRVMLLENTKINPEQVRESFRILYDEEFDMLERIENFRKEIIQLNEKNFPGKSDYQDHRAVVVYLALQYPERYFFYKFRMFKDFAAKIDYPYHPIGGRIENISQFHSLCELIQYELEQDQELLNLHEGRIKEDCYRDKDHHVLTQDFIYATVRHFKVDSAPVTQTIEPKITKRYANEFEVTSTEIDFTPRVINHIQNNIENKRIGDLGELWVLKSEIARLTEAGKKKLATKVKHVAKDEGDGTGFDILSYDIDGSEKFIEVKTTRGRANSTFYITRNELERSKVDLDNYYLYRVYNFDETSDSGDLLILQGDLTSICEMPVNFKVTLNK